MNSNDTTKKRKAWWNNSNRYEGRTSSVAGVEDIIEEMKVHMTRMQNEIDELKKTSNSLTKDNKFLKARCDSLERTTKILIQEQKWEYSAPDIPRSHWDERGFDADYIACMEEFLKDIKRDTFDLRNGGAALGVDNDNWISLGNPVISATALLHDDLLLPHWREFTNAMQLYREENPPT